MSDTTARSPEEIQADLEATRSQMTATVDELVAQLQPAHLIEVSKESLARKTEEVKVQMADTLNSARVGDTEALKKVGYAAAGVVGVIGVFVLRKVFRSR